MTNVLKISEAASLALHAATLMADEPEEPVTTTELASRLGVSEAHLSKVLQRLAKAGLVAAVRGPGGGHVLAKEPKEITLLEVYEAIDGRFVPATCLLGRPTCMRSCILGGLLKDVNGMVREQLAGTRLSSVRQTVGRGAK